MQGDPNGVREMSEVGVEVTIGGLDIQAHNCISVAEELVSQRIRGISRKEGRRQPGGGGVQVWCRMSTVCVCIHDTKDIGGKVADLC